MIMHEPLALLTTILFKGILVAATFSALAQEQQPPNITARTTQQPPQSDSRDEENHCVHPQWK
jgi:hypothetical protein